MKGRNKLRETGYGLISHPAATNGGGSVGAVLKG